MKQTYCSNCGSKLNEGENFCPKCGTEMIEEKQEPTSEQIAAKVEHLHTEQVVKDNSFKFKVVSLFDLRRKKNLLEILVLLVFIFFSMIPVYLFLPEGEQAFTANGLVSGGVVLALLLLKNRKIEAVVASIITGIAAYFFSFFVGMLGIAYALFQKNDGNQREYNAIELPALFDLIIRGLGMVAAGVVITVGSYLLTDDEGTFWVMYGLVIVGFWNLGKAIYYLVNRQALDSKIERALAEQR